MPFKATLVTSISLLLVPAVSLAAVFVAGDEVAELTKATNDDVYAAGREVNISAAVTGDVAAAGEMVEVTGGVTEDVHAAGETVKIEGQVGDDVHAAGANVRLSGIVQGDAFLAGSEVMVAQEASVGGDLYAGSANLTISGKVQGDVWAAGQVHVTSSAVIDGGMLVMSNNPPVIDEGAIITGETTFEAWEGPEHERTGFGLVGWVRSVVSLFFVSLMLVYGARAFTKSALQTVSAGVGRSLLAGVVWILLFIPVSFILLITIAGIPIALGVLALTTLVYLAAVGVAAAGVGRWILGKLTKDATGEINWAHALLGAVVYESVQLLPAVGELLTFILVLFFFGATALAFFRFIRRHDTEPDTAVKV